MRNLKNIGSFVPFLEVENLKHRLGPGYTANSQRRPVLMLLLFFNGSATKVCSLLYEGVVFGLFDSRNATKNQAFYIMGYLAHF